MMRTLGSAVGRTGGVAGALKGTPEKCLLIEFASETKPPFHA